MTLEELTRQEAGIVVYPNSRTVGVFNWANCWDDEIPTLLGPLVFGAPMGEGRLLAKAKKTAYRIEDLRQVIPGRIWMARNEDGKMCLDTNLDVLYDANDDLPRLYLTKEGEPNPEKTPALVYELENGAKIIAPEGWG